ncbi:MAG: hypothetical protein ABR881_23385 [Candidatus Sulfotelmatobacter sp.]
MPTRLASLLLVLLAVPSVSQTNIQARISQRVDQHEQRTSQVVVPPSPDVKAVRLQVLHRDATELSALSESVQSDLRQLQKGLLVKDLNENLKKLEKLSKKVRREMQ